MLDKHHYEQRTVRRKWISEGRPRGPHSNSYVTYKDKKREFRKRKRAAEKRWQEEKFEEIREAAEMEISHFYRVIKKQRKSKIVNSKLIYKGKMADSADEICNLWGTYFSDLYSETQRPNFDEEFYKYVNDEIPNIMYNKKNSVDDKPCNITTMDITSQLKNTKRKKAPGPDFITNEHIIFGGKGLTHCISKLFTAIFQCEYIPRSCKHGTIIPLYKGKTRINQTLVITGP